MLAQGSGHIVTITTSLVDQPIAGVPAALASITKGGLNSVTKELAIPTIGIGAGPDCDGQVLVLHDVIGISGAKLKFAKSYGNVAGEVARAVHEYAEDVRTGGFPDDAHSFH